MFKNTARTILCLVMILGLFVSSPVQAATDPVFDEVKALVENFYVDPIDVDSMHVHTSRELVAKLGDQYSKYMTSSEFEEFMGSIEGQYAGIGVYLSGEMLLEGIEIIGIIDGSPAQQAGLEAGDVIVAVDKKNIAGLDLDTACGMLLGPAGTQVQIEVKTGPLYKNITLIRQVINIPVVNSTLLDFKTAYIDIDSFSEGADQELVHTIETCQESGTDKWIIDLRGNPGGYIDTAMQIAGVFTGSEVVTILEERDAITRYYPDQSDIQVSDPIIVLMDENSASASEILAAALRDHRKAILLGDTTYGKGTVQEILPLSNGDWLKLTTARFYSPLGIPINGLGVDPDLWLDSSNMIKAAELLLSDPPDGGAGSYEIQANGYRFIIDLTLARSPEYWGVWGDITGQGQYLPAYKVSGGERYYMLTADQVKEKIPLYYPHASVIGTIDNLNPGQDIVLYVSQEPESGWNELGIEMYNAADGEQMDITMETGADKFIHINPVTELLPGEYWVIYRDSEQAEFMAKIEV